MQVELSRAWEREGGVKPGLARFERVLHANDLDQMERAWKELRKEGMEFAHFLKFITILLGTADKAWECHVGCVVIYRHKRPCLTPTPSLSPPTNQTTGT